MAEEDLVFVVDVALAAGAGLAPHWGLAGAALVMARGLVLAAPVVPVERAVEVPAVWAALAFAAADVVEVATLEAVTVDLDLA